MKLSVLVMGGSYFIGKHIVDALKDTTKVTVLNRGSKPLNDPKVEALVADRNDKQALKTALKDRPFDVVVDVSALNQTQVDLILDVLDTSLLKRYVFISTSAVYDIDKKTPPYHEGDPLGGDSPFGAYAANKIKAEHSLNTRLKGSKLITLRPPIVYGEDNYVLRERLMFKLIENDDPVFIPTTNNTLSFVYVKDLALQVKDCVENRVPAGTYNVGEQQPYTFLQWVNQCAEVVGKTPDIRWFDPETINVRTLDLFPFFTYDNILNTQNIHAVSHHETPLKKGLEGAYQDYQTIKDTITLPTAKQAARNMMLS